MKAYVIKNKEGEYLRGTYGKNGEYCWTKDIIDAMTYGFNEFMPQPIENCTLIPITISEGDLEEENRILKRALELACEKLITLEIEIAGYPPAPPTKNGIKELAKTRKERFIQQAKGEKDG